MTPENNDTSMDNAIRRAVASGKVQFDAERWLEQHPQEVKLLRSWKKPENQTTRPAGTTIKGWRIIMHSMKARITAGAALAAACIVVAVVLLGGNGASSKLYAEALRQLQTTSYTFDMGVEEDRRNAFSHAMRGAAMEPGRVRFDARSGGGGVSTIMDRGTGVTLILYHQYKVAFMPDEQEDEQIGGLDMLFGSERSIQDVWGLKAGDETRRGKGQINGREAEAFVTRQSGKTYATETTVWADAKTGDPIEVQISLRPTDGKAAPLVLTLSNFDRAAELDASLFSTDVPAGYTLANRRTLAQLLAGQASQPAGAEQNAAPSRAPDATSPEAEKLVRVISLWDGGEQAQAVDALLAIDWSRDFRFAKEHYLFAVSEKEIISLTQADRDAVLGRAMKQLHTWRELANAGVERGQQAAAKDDYQAAERAFLAVGALGRRLNRGPDEVMLIVRLVGMAIEKTAINEMIPLYEKTGNAEKLNTARERLAELAKQQEEIKRGT